MNPEISSPKVMHSAAGYYIGLEYYDEDLEAWLPWTRYSNYFADKKMAELVLKDFMRQEIDDE